LVQCILVAACRLILQMLEVGQPNSNTKVVDFRTFSLAQAGPIMRCFRAFFFYLFGPTGLDDRASGIILNRFRSAQVNSAEYVPSILIMCIMAELNSAQQEALFYVMAVILISRIFHTAGLWSSTGPSLGRSFLLFVFMGMICLISLLVNGESMRWVPFPAVPELSLAAAVIAVLASMGSLLAAIVSLNFGSDIVSHYRGDHKMFHL